jgi:hypothetical protein
MGVSPVFSAELACRDTLESAISWGHAVNSDVCSLFGGCFLGGLLLASALVAGVGPGLTVLGVGTTLLELLGDGGELVAGSGGGSGKDTAGGLGRGSSRLALLGGGVVDQTLLDLAVLSGEEDELGLVGVESLDVELLLLLGGAGSAVVNSDADGAGEGGAKSSSLQLVKSEATAVPDLTSIPASARGDNRSQLLERAGEHLLGLSLSFLQSNELLLSLIEVHSDSVSASILPVLAEMYVWDDVVVLDHC